MTSHADKPLHVTTLPPLPPMPSVRVRGKTYTPVQDVFPNADGLRPLSVPVAADGSTLGVHAQRRLLPRFSLPLLYTPTATMSTSGRPRAFTSASRVYAHCTLRSSRHSGSMGAQSPSSPLTIDDPLQSGELHEYDRRRAIPRMRSRGDSRRAESSVNLSHGRDDSYEALDADHHHDDVVEHLDVIGK